MGNETAGGWGKSGNSVILPFQYRIFPTVCLQITDHFQLGGHRTCQELNFSIYIRYINTRQLLVRVIDIGFMYFI